MRTFKTIALGLAAFGLATSGAASAASTRSSDALLASGAKAQKVELSRGSPAATDSQEMAGGLPIWIIILGLAALGFGIYEATKSDSNG